VEAGQLLAKWQSTGKVILEGEPYTGFHDLHLGLAVLGTKLILVDLIPGSVL